MGKQVVAALGELPEGGCKLVSVDGQEVAIFLIEGEHRAFRNFCPHAGAPLCTARPGGANYESGHQPSSVRCPWHGWEFDLRNGAFLKNPHCVLDGYRLEVADGVVSVCW